MLVLFSFQSIITCALLVVCTCAYIRALYPSLLDRNRTGLLGVFWKCARIGERLSAFVALALVCIAVKLLFID